MKRIFIFGRAIAVVSLLILAGCGAGTEESEVNGKLKVVGSYSVICNMAEKIARDNIDLDCLIDYDQDPHTYEGTPSDRQAIEDAGLILYAGLNFDPAIIKMVEATNTPAPKIPLHEKAVENLIQVEQQGDITPDPHIWHDVDNGRRMVNLIAEQLAAAIPEEAEVYRRNAAEYNRQLKKLDTWIGEQIALIPADKRNLVTTHDAMQYYVRAYGLKVEGTLIGLSTEEETTAARVKSLADAVKAAGIPTLFAELTTNDKVLQTVAKEAGVKISEDVLIADGIGKRGTPTGSYVGMLEYNTCAIVKGLSEQQCAPFEF